MRIVGYVRLIGKKLLRALRAATRGRFGTAQLQIADWRLQIGGSMARPVGNGENGQVSNFSL